MKKTTTIRLSNGYRCEKCFKTATSIPGIMSIIPEHELDAILPEREDDLSGE